MQNETVATLTTHDDGGVPVEHYTSRPATLTTQLQNQWGDHGHRTLHDFLTRPVRVASGSWASTQITNTAIATLNFPDVLMQRALLSNKLDGFTFLHAGIRLHIELTAQPTQAGILLVSYQPYSKYSITQAAGINATYTGRSGCPSQIINIASASGPRFITPYISPRSAYNLATGQGTLGTITVSVLLPLVSNAASSIPYTIFASFDNPVVSTPTAAKNSILPALVAQIGDAIIKPIANLCEDDGDDRYHLEAQIGNELSSREQTGTISGFARSVAAVAASVPPSLGLSSIVKPVEWISNATASIASYFGFSKPTSQVPITKVKQQPVSYMFNSNGVDSSHKIALLADNELETDPALFATSDDEMSISNLVTRPAALQTYTWKKTDVAGAPLFDIEVSPSQLYILQDSVNAYANGTYAWLMSQQFGLWRGDLIYTFHFAKTKFHSGRLRCAYYPYANSNNSNLQDIDNMMTYAKTEVFDLSSSDTFTFHVPFTSSTDWKMTSRTANYNERCTGKFIIEVLNPLVAPDLVSTTVAFILVAHGASNLEFAMPIRSRVRSLRFNAPAPLLDAQIGSLNCFIGNRNVDLSSNDPLRKTRKLKVKAPMAEVELDVATEAAPSDGTLEAQIGAQPTLQRSQAREYEVEHRSTNMLAQARTVGEVVPSLRPLGKRLQRIVKDGVVPPDAFVVVKPWSMSAYPNIPDFMSLYRENYQFYRGSMRIKIFVVEKPSGFDPSIPLTVYQSTDANALSPVYYNQTAQVVQYSIDATANSALDAFADSFKVFLDKEGAVEIDVAYYSQFPMCFSNITVATNPEDGSIPYPVINIEGLGDCKIDIYRSVGDDFSFGTPLGLPLLKVLTS